jgi:hypothetical protein
MPLHEPPCHFFKDRFRDQSVSGPFTLYLLFGTSTVDFSSFYTWRYTFVMIRYLVSCLPFSWLSLWSTGSPHGSSVIVNLKPLKKFNLTLLETHVRNAHEELTQTLVLYGMDEGMSTKTFPYSCPYWLVILYE